MHVERRYSSTILDLGTLKRRLVSFTFWAAFPPKERAPGTNWIGGWVGPRAVLGSVKINISYACSDSNPGRPAFTLSLYRLSYSGSQAYNIMIFYVLKQWMTSPPVNF
jgi:hypothetical protein